MSTNPPPLWCPTCQVNVAPNLAVVTPAAAGPRCPKCGALLMPPLMPADNPAGLLAVPALLGIAARLLLRSGALEALDRYAETTSSTLDDFLVGLLSDLLLRAAQL